MGNSKTPTFGPNNTNVSIIKYAAIASWGGFVYQGLCALCVVMEKILDDDTAVKDWFLNIEGYEDFALLDDNKNIISLHQAKCYKDKKDFTDEFMKMEDKRAYWCNKGACLGNIPLYFHCNQSQTFSHDVTAYKYKDGSTEKSHEEVWDHLGDLVEKYTDKHNVPGSSDVRMERLMVMMNEHVTMLDQLSKVSNVADMQSKSVEKSLPLSFIIKCLRSEDDRMTIAERVRASIVYLKVWIEKFKYDNPNDDYSKADLFLDAIERMNVEDQEKVVRKLFPDVNIDSDRNVISEITNGDRLGFLRNIILKANQMNDNDTQWILLDGLAHPSTLGKSKSTKEHCKRILKNRSSASELLRDYRWIVGDEIGYVDDIVSGAHLITSPDDENHDRITKMRKVGLTDADGIN